jgi:DNA polymerase-3 subunit alpha
MTLDELYTENNITDKVIPNKKFLFILPTKEHDISALTYELLLDKSEYSTTYPKAQDTEKSYEILMEEIKTFILPIQVDCSLSKKLPSINGGIVSDKLLNRIRSSQGDTFVNLHHHDEFSVRDGLGTVNDLAKILKSRNQTILGVSNHGSVGGWIKQYNTCKKNGLKSIFECEMYVNDYRGDDLEEKKKHRKNFHLITIAKNLEGFYNIIKLHNDAQLNGFYYLPRCNYENIKKYGKSVIGLSGCYLGEISKALQEDNFDKAKEAYDRYKEAFDEFYIELTMIEWEEQVVINKKLIEFSQKVSAPLVVSLDSHYIYPENSSSHDLLMLIRTKKTINDVGTGEKEEAWQFEVKNLYYRTEAEIRQLWEEQYKSDVFTKEVLDEAIKNTKRIAIKCENIKLDSEFKLPKLYPDADRILREKAEEGLRKRGLAGIKKYDERLEYEIEFITKAGFTDYFLIVDKIISDSRDKYGEWITGFGRGSCAGSLVSYCLKISDIDPIKYGLLFERFLDVGRVGDFANTFEL